MSQISTNESTNVNQKPYHTPQLRKFGNIEELTLTTTSFVGSDGGSGISQYGS